MLETASVECPYCGEPFETSVDCSAGAQQYIEDCPVCCQPIEMTTDVDLDSRLVAVTVSRNDD
ncbi:MAG: CPXCG motif-containing cysteine-rich protein [Thiogranum sp.]|nr:CPXCG motif-containing cysteine-rich protein [Thiogranum sp.]